MQAWTFKSFTCRSNLVTSPSVTEVGHLFYYNWTHFSETFSEIFPMLLRAMMPITSFKITRIINVPWIIYSCGILLCQQAEQPNIAASQPFHLSMVNIIVCSTNFSQDNTHLLVFLLRLPCFLFEEAWEVSTLPISSVVFWRTSSTLWWPKESRCLSHSSYALSPIGKWRLAWKHFV